MIVATPRPSLVNAKVFTHKLGDQTHNLHMLSLDDHIRQRDDREIADALGERCARDVRISPHLIDHIARRQRVVAAQRLLCKQLCVVLLLCGNAGARHRALCSGRVTARARTSTPDDGIDRVGCIAILSNNAHTTRHCITKM
jgi:hypothetical protein